MAMSVDIAYGFSYSYSCICSMVWSGIVRDSISVAKAIAIWLHGFTATWPYGYMANMANMAASLL